MLQLFVQTYHRLLSAFWHFYNQCLFNSFRQVIWLECESKVSSRRGCSSTRNSTAGDCIQAVCNWLSKGRSSVGEKGWRLNIQIQYILQYVHTTIHTTVHTYYSTYYNTYYSTYILQYIHTTVHTTVHTYVSTYILQYIHTTVHSTVHTYYSAYILQYIHTTVQRHTLYDTTNP